MTRRLSGDGDSLGSRRSSLNYIMNGDSMDDEAVDGPDDYTGSRIPCSLIVRNVPNEVFQDEAVKAEFTAHITQYAEPKNIIFLRSFRRVRFDFETPQEAYHVRTRLAMFQFHDDILHVYFIQPESNQNSQQLGSPSLAQRLSSTSIETGTSGDESDSEFAVPSRQTQVVDPEKLFPPQPERVWLISPPSSPPMHWQQIRETKPKPGIEVEILSKIAELKPGDTHELIPPTINTPQICVHVCEDMNNDANNNHRTIIESRREKTKIIQTRRPPMR